MNKYDTKCKAMFKKMFLILKSVGIMGVLRLFTNSVKIGKIEAMKVFFQGV